VLNVNLRQLRAIASLSRHRSVTRAAEELNVSPPAITLQIKAIEDILGIALVERLAGSMVLTEAGAVVAEGAGQAEAVLREIEARIADLKGAETGVIHVGIVSTAKYYAPRAIAAFAKMHPNIELKLMVGNREEIIDGLGEHNVDLAIMGRPPTDMKVACHLIGDHPHVMIAPPEHPLTTQTTLPPEVLENEVMLVREVGSGTRRLMEEYFQSNKVRPRIGMEIGSNETIKQSVMAGLGIAFISGHTIDAELRDRRLMVLDINGMPVVRQWYAVHLQARNLMPAADRLVAFLSERGSEFLPRAAINRVTELSARDGKVGGD
jgi:DNA-binding transcriptional LysR family regulator